MRALRYIWRTMSMKYSLELPAPSWTFEPRFSGLPRIRDRCNSFPVRARFVIVKFRDESTVCKTSAEITSIQGEWFLRCLGERLDGETITRMNVREIFKLYLVIVVRGEWV